MQDSLFPSIPVFLSLTLFCLYPLPPLFFNHLTSRGSPPHRASTAFSHFLSVLPRCVPDRALMGSITRLCDNAIALESFKGSERETNPLYKDYHGLIHVRQVPHLNCLASKLPDHKDLAFKLKRKQFSIERLHLPPDLSDTVSRVSRGELAGATTVASACGSGSSGNKHLDF
ncbi:Elongator subunit elp4 [Dissostichus eleginoides]|nr:Elongator subunit elp4 [Dissostichus eleginoides]